MKKNEWLQEIANEAKVKVKVKIAKMKVAWGKLEDDYMTRIGENVFKI